MAFVKAIVGENVAAFPPRVEWLQAWGRMFRCSGTFSNYLGYAKVGCMLVKQDTSVFQHPAVKRAKNSVGKSGRFAAREKLWIRRHRVEALLVWAEVSGSWLLVGAFMWFWCQANQSAKRFAELYLMCYVFLLRMPSEALPMVVAGGVTQESRQSVIWLDEANQKLVLKLLK